MTPPVRSARVLARLNWWVVLAAAAVAMLGCAFIRSATLDDSVRTGLYVKQSVLLAIAAGSGLGLILIPYRRVIRYAWVVYALAVASLIGLRLMYPLWVTATTMSSSAIRSS